MEILGIVGSLRAGSYNRQLVELAADNLPDGVELAVWDGLRDLPAYDEDDDPSTTARSRDRSRTPWTGARGRATRQPFAASPSR